MQDNKGWVELTSIKRKSKFRLSLQKMIKNLDSPGGVFLDIVSFVLVGSWLIVKYASIGLWLLIKYISLGFYLFVVSLTEWANTSADAEVLMRLGYASGFDYSEKSGSQKHVRKIKSKSKGKVRVKDFKSKNLAREHDNPTVLDILAKHVKE